MKRKYTKNKGLSKRKKGTLVKTPFSCTCKNKTKSIKKVDFEALYFNSKVL
jgi:hypothetical protein